MFNRLVIFVFLMFAFFAAHSGVVAADNKVESNSFLNSLEISLDSDTYFNSTDENITSETGLVLGFQDFTFDITPTSTNDDVLTDLRLGLSYNWQLTDDVVLTPYSEAHWDSDFVSSDKVFGIKTTIRLF